MSFFITPESLAVSALATGYRIEVRGVPELAAAFARMALSPLGAGTDTLAVQRGDSFAPGAEAARLVVFEDGADTFRMPSQLLAALGDKLGDRIVVRTGRLALQRASWQFILVMRAGRGADELAERLASWDPRHRPNLLTAATDIAHPFFGENVYGCEMFGGFYLRWQGPEPILTLKKGSELRRLHAAGARVVRIEILVALHIVPSVLNGLAAYLDGAPIPAVVVPRGAQSLVVAVIPVELLERGVAHDAPLDVQICVPVTFNGMPEGVDARGRTFTYGFCSVEIVGLSGDAHPPLAGAPIPARAVDATHAVLADLGPDLRPVNKSSLQALYSAHDRTEDGERSTALNAVVDDRLFHRLQLVRGSAGQYAFTILAAEPKVTPWGYHYIGTGEPQTLALRMKGGRLVPAERRDRSEPELLEAANILAKSFERVT